MGAKKTIAVIASTNEKAVAVVNKLSLENCRLLLISKEANQSVKLSKSIHAVHPNAELDVIDCMKEGCWEADIIILYIPYQEEKAVAALIKEVAIQKIVVSFSENRNAFENDRLQKLLKYSKIVKAFNESNSSAISLYGTDKNVLCEVSNILKKFKPK